MSLTLALEQRRLVRAGPGEVWRALAQELGLPEDMGQGGGTQAWGLVTLGGGQAPVKVTAWEPGRRVAWAGRRWGIEVRRELALEPVARGSTTLLSREVLSGWALIPLRPWYSPRRLGREGQEWLAAIARRAEALARPKAPSRLP